MQFSKLSEINESEKRKHVVPMYRAILDMYNGWYPITKIREVGYDTPEDRELQNSGVDTEITFSNGAVQYWERKLSKQAKSKEFDLGKKAICIAEYTSTGGFHTSWGVYTSKCDWICFGRHVFDSEETILHIFHRKEFFDKFWKIYNQINSEVELSKELLDYMVQNNIKKIESSGYMEGIIDKISVNSYHKENMGFCCNIYPENWYQYAKEWKIPAYKFVTDKPVINPESKFVDTEFVFGE